MSESSHLRWLLSPIRKVLSESICYYHAKVLQERRRNQGSWGGKKVRGGGCTILFRWNIIWYYLLSAQHQSFKDIYQYLYVNFRCCSWSLFSHYTICISGAEGQHQGVLQVLSFLWFLLEICTSSLGNLTRYLLTSIFSRLRPLLGAEKEGGEDIKHVNIQVGPFFFFEWASKINSCYYCHVITSGETLL